MGIFLGLLHIGASNFLLILLDEFFGHWMYIDNKIIYTKIALLFNNKIIYTKIAQEDILKHKTL